MTDVATAVNPIVKSTDPLYYAQKGKVACGPASVFIALRILKQNTFENLITQTNIEGSATPEDYLLTAETASLATKFFKRVLYCTSTAENTPDIVSFIAKRIKKTNDETKEWLDGKLAETQKTIKPLVRDTHKLLQENGFPAKSVAIVHANLKTFVKMEGYPKNIVTDIEKKKGTFVSHYVVVYRETKNKYVIMDTPTRDICLKWETSKLPEVLVEAMTDKNTNNDVIIIQVEEKVKKAKKEKSEEKAQ